MKPALFLMLFLLPLFLHADDQIKPGEEHPRTYTVGKFAKEIGVDPVTDELVCLKFNYRSSSMIDAEDKDGRQGTIYARDSGESIDVVIPPEGLAWFRRVPTSANWDINNVKSFLVYARVRVDTSGRAFVRLVGTEIKHDDLAGDSIFWH